MADWVEPIDSETDPDAPLTSQLGKRWDSNCIAIAEGSVGAPYVVTNWHPSGGADVADGIDGVLYDFAADGSQTAVVIGPLNPIKSYMVRADDLRPDSAVDRNLRLEGGADGVSWSLEDSTSSAFNNSNGYNSATVARDAGLIGDVNLFTMNELSDNSGHAYYRLSWTSGGNFGAGVVTLYEKLEYGT